MTYDLAKYASLGLKVSSSVTRLLFEAICNQQEFDIHVNVGHRRVGADTDPHTAVDLDGSADIRISIKPRA
jgi:hypothetical protein